MEIIKLQLRQISSEFRSSWQNSEIFQSKGILPGTPYEEDPQVRSQFHPAHPWRNIAPSSRNLNPRGRRWCRSPASRGRWRTSRGWFSHTAAGRGWGSIWTGILAWCSPGVLTLTSDLGPQGWSS